MTYQLSDFDFELPEELIAQTPAEVRSQSRLLDVHGEQDLHDRRFTDLVDLLNPGDLVIFNNSKVIAARLFAKKPSGGRVEILVERIGPAPNQASALLRVSRKPAAGMRLQLGNHEDVTCLGRDPAHDDRFQLEFSRPVLDVLDDFGQLPLPPTLAMPQPKTTCCVIKRCMPNTPGRWPHPRRACILTRRSLRHFRPRAFSVLK